MQLWTLTGGKRHHEKEHLTFGVFSSKEKAETFMVSLMEPMTFDYFNIEEFTFDDMIHPY